MEPSTSGVRCGIVIIQKDTLGYRTLTDKPSRYAKSYCISIGLKGLFHLDAAALTQRHREQKDTVGLRGRLAAFLQPGATYSANNNNNGIGNCDFFCGNLATEVLDRDSEQMDSIPSSVKTPWVALSQFGEGVPCFPPAKWG